MVTRTTFHWWKHASGDCSAELDALRLTSDCIILLKPFCRKENRAFFFTTARWGCVYWRTSWRGLHWKLTVGIKSMSHRGVEPTLAACRTPMLNPLNPPPPSYPTHPPHALLKRDVHLDNVLHMHRMLRGQQEANCSSTLASPCQRWRIQKRIILLPLLRVSPRLNKYDRIHTPAFAGSQSTIQDCCHSLVFKISAHIQPSRLKTRLAGWETFRDKQCAMWFAEYFWDSLKDLGVLFVFLDEPSILRKIDLWIFGISPLKRWTMKMYLSAFSYVCYTGYTQPKADKNTHFSLFRCCLIVLSLDTWAYSGNVHVWYCHVNNS